MSDKQIYDFLQTELQSLHLKKELQSPQLKKEPVPVLNKTCLKQKSKEGEEKKEDDYLNGPLSREEKQKAKEEKVIDDLFDQLYTKHITKIKELLEWYDDSTKDREESPQFKTKPVPVLNKTCLKQKSKEALVKYTKNRLWLLTKSAELEMDIMMTKIKSVKDKNLNSSDGCKLFPNVYTQQITAYCLRVDDYIKRVMPVIDEIESYLSINIRYMDIKVLDNYLADMENKFSNLKMVNADIKHKSEQIPFGGIW